MSHCQYHQRLALNRVHVRAHPHSVRFTPSKPIVYFGERAFAKLNACIATTIYFPSHMRLGILAELLSLRNSACNDPIYAPPGCLENDAVVCRPFDASTSYSS
jgi:hypothetical protein